MKRSLVKPSSIALTSLASEYMTCEQLSGSSGMSMMELGELASYSDQIQIALESRQPKMTAR